MKTGNLSFAKPLMVFLILLALTFSSGGVTPARAAGLIVNSMLDTIAVDGQCTLREAIQNANDNAATNADCAAGGGADTITFSVSGTITLGSKLPTIYDTAGLTIDGAGQTVKISGNYTVQVASIGYNALLALSNLTIANGSTTTNPGGGGIYNNYGALTITNVIFSGNSAIGTVWGQGGGIYNGGTLIITNSSFTGNNARLGGGIYNNGNLDITNSVFSGSNSAKDGGAIYTNNPATITNSTFSSNSAIGGNGGGGIYNSGSQLTITDCAFSNNSANYSRGGGIYSYYGGGNGVLTVSNSTFSGNTAASGEGGGIFVYTRATITNSTFTLNSAGTGGGVYNHGWLSTIANSTFSENSATSSGGGGIFNDDTLVIINNTLSDNSAGNGGGIGSIDGMITLRNTIVANNTGGNCSGTITNGANNIDSGTTCSWGTANGSMSNANPLLGALTGSPAYFPLNSGSPAINTGDDPICAASPVNNQSQNKVTRPQGAHCDIGSYEKPVVIITRTLTSAGAYDGWVLESTETSGMGGGTPNTSAIVFRLGDDALRRQYRAILHFNTGATLPDTAVVTKATLKIKKQGLTGANPFSNLGGLRVDMQKPFFGTTAGLLINDFQATAGKSSVATFGITPVNNWYSAVLNATGKTYINLTGLTQFRLRFAMDDNNNSVADYMQFFSGNYATSSDKPALIVQYYVP